jgi:hypothetical protein
LSRKHNRCRNVPLGTQARLLVSQTVQQRLLKLNLPASAWNNSHKREPRRIGVDVPHWNRTSVVQFYTKVNREDLQGGTLQWKAISGSFWE